MATELCATLSAVAKPKKAQAAAAMEPGCVAVDDEEDARAAHAGSLE